ncbi:Hypothetical_protein [Hexamita inflata]|uniref:Hypothetical_protein n=1 Tax=Hexamita inflata TaxID=28002 RepID=A0AA86PY48_9EUKA|nr:Hypothetical protein HINF_LOCUS31090 [Hexamita inflata]
MKQYIVVHLPVKIQNPNQDTVPAEDVHNHLAQHSTLKYNLTANMQVSATTIADGMFSNDYILDKDSNQVMGHIQQQISFQSVAPLFLSESIYAINQPLNQQVRTNFMSTNFFQESHEVCDWLVKAAQVVPPITRAIKPDEKYIFDLFQHRQVIPAQFVSFLNQKMQLKLSNWKLIKILRQLCYQKSNGLFRSLWIQRGYQPQSIGFISVQSRFKYIDKTESEVIYNRHFVQKNLLPYQIKYPNVFNQCAIMFDPHVRHFSFQSFCLSDFVTGEAAIKEFEFKNGQELHEKVKWIRSQIIIEAQEFFSNLLKILKDGNGTDSIRFIHFEEHITTIERGMDVYGGEARYEEEESGEDNEEEEGEDSSSESSGSESAPE